MTKLFPYSSPEARTAAGEMLVRGQWSLTDPQGNPKPEGPPLDELLWDIGHALGRDQGDLRACHELIPEEIAPRTDATLGEKARLSDRLRIVMERLKEAEALK